MGSFVPATDLDRKEMLSVIGIESIEDLFGQLPQEVMLKDGLNLPRGMSEMEVCKEMEGIAAKNKVFPVIFRGVGAYRHYIPAVVKSVLSKETLYTAYTPYQAEISQGILQSIFEYQTMICELTGMDTANASVYDGAAAAAEAVAMCRDRKKTRAFVSAAVHPQVMETIKTYCFGNGMELTVIPEKDGMTDLNFLKEHIDRQTACVYIQNPNYYGSLELAGEIGSITKEADAKYIMGVNPISLGVIKTPEEYGADIAVGEGQPLGLPLSFGGPYIGFMACTKELTRKLPGRIVGETVDFNGKTGYVLTLQAREQHIRREKALSNICSNQALCALAVGVYLSAMGAEGLKQTAIQCMSKAHYMANQLEAIGYPVINRGEFFHEFVTISKIPVEKVMSVLEDAGILGGYPLTGERAGQILWCCTEMNAKDDIDRVIGILKEV
ncbi:aminomethyl-transferring glycine dehydrogenase subunit GcvPA [Lachnoclostridium sp.]|uniref:aminomethyl-transferring glycine dehydrogenase subunit GcvPA n=1 Tax=Lachnoclostridium sp. TaxID=2028282 RepID=UPI00289B2EC3|nr:aminomethyl-transferring glycine dehydrogenase subunit GcvPA [Lachnoclostridium sp.]